MWCCLVQGDEEESQSPCLRVGAGTRSSASRYRSHLVRGACFWAYAQARIIELDAEIKEQIKVAGEEAEDLPLVEPMGVRVTFKKAVTLQAAGSWLPLKAVLYQKVEVREEGAAFRQVFRLDGARGQSAVLVQQLDEDLLEAWRGDCCFLAENWPVGGDKSCLFEEDRVQSPAFHRKD